MLKPTKSQPPNEPKSSQELKLTTLGALRLEPDGFSFRKPLVLLSVLRLGNEERYARRYVAELLWPGKAPEKALHSLTQDIARLNTVAPGLVKKTTKEVFKVDIACDYEELRSAYKAQDTERVISLYRGSFLRDIELEFDASTHTELLEWVEEHRQEAQNMLLDTILYNGASVAERVSAVEAALLVLDLTTLDPDALLQMSALLLLGGSTRLATVRDALQASGHPPQTYEQARVQLFQHPSGVTQVPFLAPALTQPTLFGRSEALKHLKGVLTSGSLRGVVVQGLPGIGKTALVLAAAYDGEVLETFPDGILWAGLGQKPRTSVILGAWLRAFGLSPEELGGLDTVDMQQELLQRVLGGKRVLIVLDDAWRESDVTPLMFAAVHLRFVVTTRSPEVALSLEHQGVCIQALSELCLQDARAFVQARIPELMDVYREHIERLLQHVGGLPLALSLLVGHLRNEAHAGLSGRVQAALARLEDARARQILSQPQVHGHYPGLAPNDKLSLTNVIGLSVAALSQPLQAELHRLSLFQPKPYTFAEGDATAVLQEGSTSLYSLVDTGLIEAAGRDRLSMHQSIFDYLSVTAGNVPKNAWDRYATHVVSDEYARLDLEALLLDDHNLEVLVDVLQAQQDPRFATVVNLMYPVWDTRGRLARAHFMLEQAYAATQETGNAFERMRTLLHSGRLANLQGATAQGITALREGLEISLRVGAEEEQSSFYYLLGGLHINAGKLNEAERLLQDAERCAHRFKQNANLASAVVAQGVVRRVRGDLTGALRLFEKALPYAEQQPDLNLKVKVYQNISGVELDRKNYQRARHYAEAGLVLASRLGHLYKIANVSINKGLVAWELGDQGEAHASLKRALEISRQLGYHEDTAHCLAELGAFAIASSDLGVAAAYLQEALDLARSLENPFLLGWVLIVSARGTLATRDTSASFARLDEALELAAQLESQELAGLALFCRSRTHAQNGERQAALTDAFASRAKLKQIGHKDTGQVEQWLLELRNT